MDNEQKSPSAGSRSPIRMAHCPETAACRQAVTRAYETLVKGGADERVAFKAARAVYTWHHPEVPKRLVPYVISEWLP